MGFSCVASACSKRIEVFEFYLKAIYGTFFSPIILHLINEGIGEMNRLGVGKSYLKSLLKQYLYK